jgi:hypothetical protein
MSGERKGAKGGYSGSQPAEVTPPPPPTPSDTIRPPRSAQSTRRVRFVNDSRGPRLEDWATRELIEQVSGVTIIATPGEPVQALVLFCNIEVDAEAVMEP